MDLLGLDAADEFAPSERDLDKNNDLPPARADQSLDRQPRRPRKRLRGVGLQPEGNRDHARSRTAAGAGQGTDG